MKAQDIIKRFNLERKENTSSTPADEFWCGFTLSDVTSIRNFLEHHSSDLIEVEEWGHGSYRVVWVNDRLIFSFIEGDLRLEIFYTVGDIDNYVNHLNKIYMATPPAR